MFDSRRGGGSFPLEGKGPIIDVPSLQKALNRGYAVRLTPPAPVPGATTHATTTAAATLPTTTLSAATQLAPTRLPTTRLTAADVTAPDLADVSRLTQLVVNVSGWRVRPEYQPSQLSKDAAVERTLTANHVEYIAEPLKYEKGSLSVRFVAEDAELQLLKDKSGVRGLLMSGAREGSLHFHTTTEELQRLFSAGIKNGGAGASVDDVQVFLSSDNPRSLQGVIEIRGSWLFLPMTLRIFGRLDVDNGMLATFSHVGCTGEGPAGDLIAPFIDRAMKKMDGRVQPLMAFKDGTTHATDFRVRTGQNFDLWVNFGK